MSPPNDLRTQLACVEREVRMRERVYGNAVQIGRMRQSTADTEIAVMRAVADTLRGLLDKESDLFARPIQP